jgi:hypothetical protein
LRDRTAADTALAEKSKGDTPLGYVRYELLAEAWDSISRLGRELFDERTRVAELEAENAKLRACVEAADDLRTRAETYRGLTQSMDRYDAARAEVDK